MTRLTRLCRTVGVGLAVTTATLAMTQVADAKPAPPAVPPGLAVPANNQMFLVGHGKGVQIYTCDGTKWVLPSVPRADLVDDAGNLIVKHFAGPTWQSTADNSTVTAKAAAKDPADKDFDPATAKDIQQLLLQATSTSGSGVLGATTYIQRLNTKHGTQPPAAECKAQTAGKVKEVNYTADYYFWKATA